MTDIVENWKLYYFKCTRFTGWQTNWDGKEEFTLTDAMGIGHTVLMLPVRALLKALDMLQPIAKKLSITCASGVNSLDWMLGSALLWLFIIAIVLQLTGWKIMRWNRKPGT